MEDVDFETKQITPESLTKILQENEYLSSGVVLSVEQKPLDFTGVTSIFFSLHATYSKESESRLGVNQLPKKIIMKMIKPKFYPLFLKESALYHAVLGDLNLPALTCFGIDKSPETKQGYLLFGDMTETHYNAPQDPLPPFEDECKEAVIALAKTHAYWWDHPSFGQQNFEYPTKADILQFIKNLESDYFKFVDYLGDRLSSKRKSYYDAIFRKIPELIDNRVSNQNKFTLRHGDAHFGNFLFPTDKNHDQCIIHDWQFWDIELGVRDLAYMLVFSWLPEQRQRLEKPLIKYYFEELQSQEINYSWEELQKDYRISVIINSLIPIYQFAGSQLPPMSWWVGLEKTFSAFEDLNCMEFL